MNKIDVRFGHAFFSNVYAQYYTQTVDNHLLNISKPQANEVEIAFCNNFRPLCALLDITEFTIPFSELEFDSDKPIQYKELCANHFGLLKDDSFVFE